MKKHIQKLVFQDKDGNKTKDMEGSETLNIGDTFSATLTELDNQVIHYEVVDKQEKEKNEVITTTYYLKPIKDDESTDIKNHPVKMWLLIAVVLFAVAGSILSFESWQKIGGIFVYLALFAVIMAIVSFFKKKGKDK